MSAFFPSSPVFTSKRHECSFLRVEYRSMQGAGYCSKVCAAHRFSVCGSSGAVRQRALCPGVFGHVAHELCRWAGDIKQRTSSVDTP